MPRKKALLVQILWSRGVQKILPVVANINVRIEGLENMKSNRCIVACKHQSMWETTIFHGLLEDPAIVIKKELLGIPLFGWYCRKVKMIAVDRSAGPRALKPMLRQAKEAIRIGRPIVIFPEGTRIGTDTKTDYQSGIYAIYKSLQIPVVPMALNAGQFWSQETYLRYPGTIILKALPPIEPGLARDEFMANLERSIENATAELNQNPSAII